MTYVTYLLTPQNPNACIFAFKNVLLKIIKLFYVSSITKVAITDQIESETGFTRRLFCNILLLKLSSILINYVVFLSAPLSQRARGAVTTDITVV